MSSPSCAFGSRPRSNPLLPVCCSSRSSGASVDVTDARRATTLPFSGLVPSVSGDHVRCNGGSTVSRGRSRNLGDRLEALRSRAVARECFADVTALFGVRPERLHSALDFRREPSPLARPKEIQDSHSVLVRRTTPASPAAALSRRSGARGVRLRRRKRYGDRSSKAYASCSLASDARASPPLMSGTMLNSSAVTLSRFTV